MLETQGIASYVWIPTCVTGQCYGAHVSRINSAHIECASKKLSIFWLTYNSCRDVNLSKMPAGSV